ncbi:MAG: TadE/TadG family type IV pilus assembly protein [Pseudomonadota bacterium]
MRNAQDNTLMEASEQRHSGIFMRMRSFRRNNRGVAAVEFALVFPLLLTMYIGTLEISMGMTVNKRVARVASTIADLVTQQDELSRSELHAIMRLSESVMYPYDTTKPKVLIIGVDVDDAHPNWGKVAWSRGMDEAGNFVAGRTKGSDIVVPNRLRFDDSFLVMVQTDIKYVPVVAKFTGKDASGNPLGVNTGETYWLAPRLPVDITCKDC